MAERSNQTWYCVQREQKNGGGEFLSSWDKPRENSIPKFKSGTDDIGITKF